MTILEKIKDNPALAGIKETQKAIVKERKEIIEKIKIIDCDLDERSKKIADLQEKQGESLKRKIAANKRIEHLEATDKILVKASEEIIKNQSTQ